MGRPRHARTRLDGVPSVERGTLLAIPGERRAGFEGRRRGVARAQGPGFRIPGRCSMRPWRTNGAAFPIIRTSGW